MPNAATHTFSCCLSQLEAQLLTLLSLQLKRQSAQTTSITVLAALVGVLQIMASTIATCTVHLCDGQPVKIVLFCNLLECC